MRSLQRPNAKAFIQYLVNRTAATTILDQAGTPMGQVVDVDRARVNATGSRIIRGLYFVEMGKPLALNAVVRVEATAGLRSHDADALKIARVYSMFSDRRDGEIGKAFSYVAGFGPGISVWMMLLYDYFVWVGTVDCRTADASVLPLL